MLTIAEFEQSPGDKSNYSIHWEDYLPEGVTIASASWQIVPLVPLDANLTKVSEADDGSLMARISVESQSGAKGKDYRAECTIVTSDTPSERLTLAILIKVR